MITGKGDQTETIIQADRVRRSVPGEAGPRTIIDDFSFAFKRGRIYTIVGPSGSGKTSLLRLFNRLDEKDDGRLLFHGRVIDDYPVTELRQKVALVFQVSHMFPGTVASNLAFCCPGQVADDAGFTGRMLELVGLVRDMAGRDPEKLSVGQKQRVALARALVQDPEVLLLDEPTSALDPGAARTIEQLITRLNRELHLTIIAVTHNFRQAQRLEGTSLVLIDGRLIEWGLSCDLFANPHTSLTRAFVNGELP